MGEIQVSKFMIVISGQYLCYLDKMPVSHCTIHVSCQHCIKTEKIKAGFFSTGEGFIKFKIEEYSVKGHQIYLYNSSVTSQILYPLNHEQFIRKGSNYTLQLGVTHE